MNEEMHTLTCEHAYYYYYRLTILDDPFNHVLGVSPHYVVVGCQPITRFPERNLADKSTYTKLSCA